VKRFARWLLLASLLVCLLSGTAFASTVIAKYGSQGTKVEQVQAMLQQVKLYYGPVDGDFGKLTLEAVKQFQRKYRLSATGMVDKNMYKLLAQKSKLDFDRYRKVWVMEATGYSAQDPGNGSRTATGMYLRKGIVAVDPLLIPLGTRLYIVGYGEAIAADTGGAIRGNNIDLAFNTHGEALRWGRRTVKVYIL